MGQKRAPNVLLIEATDEAFQWMLGGCELQNGLNLPEGGVDDPVVLGIVRKITAQLHAAGCRGSWMIVVDGEVVGLCSYRRPVSEGDELLHKYIVNM